jgi:hypothetical protein
MKYWIGLVLLFAIEIICAQSEKGDLKTLNVGLEQYRATWVGANFELWPLDWNGLFAEMGWKQTERWTFYLGTEIAVHQIKLSDGKREVYYSNHGQNSHFNGYEWKYEATWLSFGLSQRFSYLLNNKQSKVNLYLGAGITEGGIFLKMVKTDNYVRYIGAKVSDFDPWGSDNSYGQPMRTFDTASKQIKIGKGVRFGFPFSFGMQIKINDVMKLKLDSTYEVFMASVFDVVNMRTVKTAKSIALALVYSL